MHEMNYVTRHFVGKKEFVEQSGSPEKLVDALWEARAMPGVVYSRSPEGNWWSALAAALGTAPATPPRGEHFYSPGAVWWCRRALLRLRRDGSAGTAAASNRDHFIEAFLKSLETEPHAERAFPSAFADGCIDPAAAREVATTQWNDWVNGAFAVCLRRFSGESCVRKEALGRRIRDHFEREEDKLSDDALFDLMERLESLMLPFAPWERENGTPGKAVDRSLAALSLGKEQPYLPA